MKEFGKANFPVALRPTSAFPLDARCVFSDLASAKAAAATAEEIGSKNTIYYYGMRILVDDGTNSKWYTIQRNNTLLEDGKGIAQISSGEGFASNNNTYHMYFLKIHYTDGTSEDIWLRGTQDGTGLYLFDTTVSKINGFYPVSAVTVPEGRFLENGDVLISSDGNGEVYIAENVGEKSNNISVFTATYRFSVKGPRGLTGKSAYQYAVDGGYEGTEAEFIAKMAEDPANVASTAITAHNEDEAAHSDIRQILQDVVDRLNAVLDSDDKTLDELSEIVAYIKSNKTLIEEITDKKVNVSDIANDLKTNDTKKPLSAAQGVALKRLIDDLSPTAATAILFVAQELDAQKQAQARGNIGAAKAIVVEQGTSEIQPDVFYDFGEVSSLELTLAQAPDDQLAHEYTFEFIPKSDFTEMTITPEPKWVSDPIVTTGKTHQVSILRGVGVMASA